MNKIKNTSSRFGLYLCTVAAAIVFTSWMLAPTGVQAESEPRPWRDEPTLRVNRSPAYRAVVRADLAAGEAQMRALCAAPDFEEIWAYVPGEKLWIELGCCERTTKDGNYIGIEVYVYRLLKKYDELAIYHIHPKTTFIRDTYHADKQLIKTVEEALPLGPGHQRGRTALAPFLGRAPQGAHHLAHRQPPRGHHLWPHPGRAGRKRSERPGLSLRSPGGRGPGRQPGSGPSHHARPGDQPPHCPGGQAPEQRSGVRALPGV